MGYGDIGYLQAGGKHGRILTPALDKLTSQGMRFTDAYAGPVCAATRCALLTGRHVGHCSVRRNAWVIQDENKYQIHGLETSDVGIGTVLKKVGYTTYLVGKWQLGQTLYKNDPLSKGFDHFYGQIYNASDYYPSQMWEDCGYVTIPRNVGASCEACGPDRENCSWSGDLWTASVIKIFKQHSESEQQFFMLLSYTAPHVGSIGNSKKDGFPVPRISKGPYKHMEAVWGRSEMEYAAAVTELDTQVGIVLDALDDYGLAGNTVVLFASDNGATNKGHNYKFFESSGNLRGFKESLHEGGHRTPFVVRWPGVVSPNTVTSHQFALYDVMATTAESQA